MKNMEYLGQNNIIENNSVLSAMTKKVKLAAMKRLGDSLKLNMNLRQL